MKYLDINYLRYLRKLYSGYRKQLQKCNCKLTVHRDEIDSPGKLTNTTVYDGGGGNFSLQHLSHLNPSSDSGLGNYSRVELGELSSWD